MFAKVENGVVTEWSVAEYVIRATYPDTSFPSPISDKALAHFGYVRFVFTSPIVCDDEFQEAKEITPVLNGIEAVQQWEIVEKYTPEEKAAYIAAKEAALAAQQTPE